MNRHIASTMHDAEIAMVMGEDGGVPATSWGGVSTENRVGHQALRTCYSRDARSVTVHEKTVYVPKFGEQNVRIQTVQDRHNLLVNNRYTVLGWSAPKLTSVRLWTDKDVVSGMPEPPSAPESITQESCSARTLHKDGNVVQHLVTGLRAKSRRRLWLQRGSTESVVSE